nr:hypothetical protein [uncultured Glaciecola sp.]
MRSKNRIAPVFFDGAITYSFEIGFISSGDYTLALTCSSDTDPEGDDDIEFIAITETNVGENGSTTVVSFIVTD